MASQPRPRILIWRHGQTDWNVENRFQGHSDIPLNEVGFSQVAYSARILAGMSPTKIISSDLIRARQTAEALSKIVNLPVHIDVRIRETHGGNWEGKTGTENRAADSSRFLGWLSGSDEPAGETGERRTEVAERAFKVVRDELAQRESSGDSGLIVLVTHGGTARCLLGKALNLPVEQWGVLGGLSNASWSILEQDRDDKWILTEHNAGSSPELFLGNEVLGGSDMPKA